MKSHTKSTLSIALILALVGVYSCKKESISTTNNGSSTPNTPLVLTAPGSEGCMEFAAETANPYTVANMQAALLTLATNNEIECDTSKFNIRATHKYIKFMPLNEVQYDSLNDDTTMILFDYPLHLKMTKGGTYYKDPAVQEGQPNYQWTCVPIDKVLPAEIPYTILAELYIPEEDPNLIQYYDTPFDDCITLLIDEALKRTGNYDTSDSYDAMTSGGDVLSLIPSKFTPKGNVTVFDDRLNANIGILGAKVRANRWFETRESMADYYGNFNVLHKFRHPVNYSIKWERGDFHIRSGTFGQAYFNGPKKKGDWYLNIVKNGASWVYAHVHRGALRYHYLDIGGIKRPGQKNLRYWVYNHSSPGTHSGVNWSELVKIWRFDNHYNAYTADEIFTTTIHETAHSSHLDLLKTGAISIITVSQQIVESYAIGVEWKLTKMEYRGRGISDYSGPGYFAGNVSYPINFAYQYWNQSIDPDYTSLFIDLIDDYNQISSSFVNPINDPVSGYTLSDIENHLRNVIGLGSLKNELKAHKPSGVTDQDLDDLISQF